MSNRRFEKKAAAQVVEERSTCGFRRRLFKADDGAPTSVTHLSVHDARLHWHQNTHEFYYVLGGTGALVIDGEEVALEPGDCVWIKPGARHYAVGALEALIIATPAYDPADTFFEGQPAKAGAEL
jgi:mannose-6-phosphate isomerase-like protein (cupin superfamily)